MTGSEPTLDDVGESTALRVYDSQFEGCYNVNADEDPRPCLSFYIMTDFGIARLCSSYQDGFGNEAHRLAIPNLGKIPERERKSIGRHADQKTLELVDAEILPNQRDPYGEDPVTGLPIEVTGFGFDVKPWGERECANCGRPCDATTADRVPDGYVHSECNPSNWGDASLEAFTDGGRSLQPGTEVDHSNTPTCTRAYCRGCETDFGDVDELIDHECSDDAPEFMRQQGLDGSLGDGQATLDGGIHPPDRGQVSIWPTVLLGGVGLAILATAILVGAI